MRAIIQNMNLYVGTNFFQLRCLEVKLQYLKKYIPVIQHFIFVIKTEFEYHPIYYLITFYLFL